MGKNVEMIKMVKMVRPDLILILGADALSLFDYFGVDELHGLNRNACIERIKAGGTYIDGMCNVIPEGSGKVAYYLFINKKALSPIKVKNYALIFHEATHYCFSKYWNDLQEKEEELITEAENLGIDIYRTIGL